jgi:hypothetical protein
MRYIKQAVTFLVILAPCLVASEIVWDAYLPGQIYNCSDCNLFGVLMPGSWVHGNYVTVSKINTYGSMSQPDSIKEGWSLEKLWFLWFSVFFASVAISVSLTVGIFYRRKEISS